MFKKYIKNKTNFYIFMFKKIYLKILLILLFYCIKILLYLIIFKIIKILRNFS